MRRDFEHEFLHFCCELLFPLSTFPYFLVPFIFPTITASISHFPLPSQQAFTYIIIILKIDYLLNYLLYSDYFLQNKEVFIEEEFSKMITVHSRISLEGVFQT